MTCQACGGQMPSDANFCPSCGAKVTREAQSPPSVSSADASDVEATAMMSASELEELLAAAAAKTGESAPETPAPKARSERRVSVTSGTIDLDGGGSSASAEAEPPPETSQSAAMTQYEMEVLEGVDESGVGPVIRRPGSTDAGMPIPQPVTRQVVAPPGQPETPTKAMDLQGLRDARDRVQERSGEDELPRLRLRGRVRGDPRARSRPRTVAREREAGAVLHAERQRPRDG